MSEKFRNKYRVDSARLKNYDYAQNGAYFITIVTQQFQCFFGKIVDDKMVLNDIGEIAKKYWLEIPQHFPFIELGEMVVMPNHIHGILCINHSDDDVPRTDMINRRGVINHRDSINRVSTMATTGAGGITGKNNPMFYKNISRVIRWYKGRCAFEINKIYGKFYFAWQPRFYDRIIHKEKELNRINDYIILNPERWEQDRNNNDFLIL